MPTKKKITNEGWTPKIDFNVIVTTVIGAVIVLLISNWAGKSGKTSETVSDIKTQTQMVQKDVSNLTTSLGEVKADVKEARANMVTRTELDNKHKALQDSIGKVSDRQERFQTQLDQIQTKGKR